MSYGVWQLSLIYILRHGETQWNREEIFRGQADIPLNDAGREQARLAGLALAGKGIETIYSSPLSRAMETAQIVAAALGGIEVRPAEALTDIHFGVWQGLPLAKVRSDYPDLYETWRTRPERARFPGGETLEQVEARAWRFLVDVAGSDMKGPALLVTHRVVSKLLLCKAMGVGAAGFWRVRQDTTALNLLEWARGDWVVRLVNDTCHLSRQAAGRDF